MLGQHRNLQYKDPGIYNGETHHSPLLGEGSGVRPSGVRPSSNGSLLIIGSGPGGYRAAEYAAKNGLGVTIVERGDVGGTCLNAGCIPTKAYVRHAELLEALRRAGEFGIGGTEGCTFDFARAVERKDSIVGQLREGVSQLLASPGITLVRGEATLKDAHTVTVNGTDYTANSIIIATGSSPKVPRLEEMDAETACTSDQLLRRTTLPRRLAIVGAGVIGMELASAFRAFGSEVVVMEFLKECLPTMDADIAKRLRKQLEKRGVEFYMQSAVKAVQRGKVVFERKGKVQEVEADCCLLAVGRKPNVEGLGLEKAGVDFDAKGIHVDDNMQTNIPGIYAIGDVNGRQMLAHAATMQGFRAVNHILGRKDAIQLHVMPSAVFTLPEAASVGMGEDFCKEHGIECRTGRAYHRANGKAMAMGETEGMVKLTALADGRIVGCHAYGAHAADMVQEAAALICQKSTVDDLKAITHIHPTVGELLQEAALAT